MSIKEGFEVTEITAFYDNAFTVIRDGINTGKENIGVGLFSVLGLYDLLHGGPYAAPINQRPFFMADPTQSKYFAGNLQNIPSGTDFVTWLEGYFGGTTSGALWAKEALMDANVPHFFPKIISDETFSQVKVLFSQLATINNWQNAATALTTLVEGTVEPLMKSGTASSLVANKATK